MKPVPQKQRTSCSAHCTFSSFWKCPEPSGRKVTDQGINIFRLVDGRIVEMWVSQDSLGLLQQLGFIPMTTPSSANEDKKAHH